MKGVQTERLRDELSDQLDRVDRISPPTHDRLAAYRRIRVGR